MPNSISAGSSVGGGRGCLICRKACPHPINIKLADTGDGFIWTPPHPSRSLGMNLSSHFPDKIDIRGRMLEALKYFKNDREPSNSGVASQVGPGNSNQLLSSNTGGYSGGYRSSPASSSVVTNQRSRGRERKIRPQACGVCRARKAKCNHKVVPGIASPRNNSKSSTVSGSSLSQTQQSRDGISPSPPLCRRIMPAGLAHGDSSKTWSAENAMGNLMPEMQSEVYTPLYHDLNMASISSPPHPVVPSNAPPLSYHGGMPNNCNDYNYQSLMQSQGYYLQSSKTTANMSSGNISSSNPLALGPSGHGYKAQPEYTTSPQIISSPASISYFNPPIADNPIGPTSFSDHPPQSSSYISNLNNGSFSRAEANTPPNYNGAGPYDHNFDFNNFDSSYQRDVGKSKMARGLIAIEKEEQCARVSVRKAMKRFAAAFFDRGFGLNISKLRVRT